MPRHDISRRPAPTSPPPRAIVSVRHVRRRALKIIAFGLVAAAAWTGFVMLLAERGRQLWGPGLGVPAVPLLAGLVELVSGRTFEDLAQSWDELKGWQRGILGLVIVAIATTVIVVAGGLIAVAMM